MATPWPCGGHGHADPVSVPPTEGARTTTANARNEHFFSRRQAATFVRNLSPARNLSPPALIFPQSGIRTRNYTALENSNLLYLEKSS